jgi:3-dehydrotetronate 4-kinase
LAAAAGADVVQQALSWVSPLLAKGPVLIYATAEPQLVKTIQNQLGVAQAGELVEHLLSQIAKGLMQAGVRQLVVAGGETSGAVVQALDVKRMLIGPQIDPGVPWTTVSSSVCNNETVHIALKSGNFGSPDFFAKAFSLLKSA